VVERDLFERGRDVLVGPSGEDDRTAVCVEAENKQSVVIAREGEGLVVVELGGLGDGCVLGLHPDCS
jgi:hypothetical protein